jgi:transposase
MPSPLNVGVDVAKDWLQVTCAGSPPEARQGANRRAAICAWLTQLPPGSRVAMEATGGYHQLLADLAHVQGMLVYVLNPCDLRHYAHAVGIRGKTDRVDAIVIARYLERESAALHPYLPPPPAQRQIDCLLRRRATVVASKTQLRLSLDGVPGCGRELRAVRKRLDAIIAKIDDRLIHFAKGQAEAQPRVQSVLGIGPLTGIALTNLFTRVPLRDGDAAVAFVGLDPRPKDSGQFIGRRRLSKRGPAELRRLLFNAARSASKTTLWRPLYERYRARGLSTTEATVILARKLLRVAFSIYRHNTTFDPKRFAHA